MEKYCSKNIFNILTFFFFFTEAVNRTTPANTEIFLYISARHTRFNSTLNCAQIIG